MTQLVVEKIFPMAADAKSGGLKATNGNIYKFLPWQAKFITEGAELDVPIVESSFNGKNYLWFAKSWPPKEQQNAARPTPPAAQSASPAPQQSARLTNTTPDRDVLITATALMKSFIETGQFGLTDLETLMKACVPAARLMVKAACGTPSQ